MARDIDIREGIDWTTVWLYAALVFFGWLNIYAAVYNPENPIEIVSLSHNAGRQLIFICASFLLILIILFVDYKVYDSFAYIFYGIIILVLIGTIFAATEIKGSRSWIKVGTFSFQPAEFSKVFTALALARYLSTQNVNISRFRDAFVAGVMVFLPPVIIILQKE
ncbi:MAG TPA: FtsW/RodA/SpoVE family cell cycle protein, partial [Emticicia sp.]